MVRESLYLFIARILSAAFGLIFSAMVTSHFDSQAAGYLFLILSVASTLTPLGLFGYGHLALKIDFKTLDQRAYLFRALKVVVLNASFLAAISLLFLFSIDENVADQDSAFIISAIFLILLTSIVNELFNYVFQSMGSAWRGVLFLVILRQILNIIYIYAFKPSSIESVIVFYSITSIASLFVAIYVINFLSSRKAESRLTNCDYSLKSRFTFTGIHFLGAVSAGFLPMLVGGFNGVEATAFFVVALKIASMVSFVIVPVNRVLAPRFAAAVRSGKKGELQQLASKSFLIITLLATPLLLIMLLFSDELLGFFGEEYVKNSIDIMKIMLLGQFINALCGSVGWLMQMCGLEKTYLTITCVGVLVSLLLGVALNELFGTISFAWAYTASLAITNLLSAAIVWKKLKVNIFKI